MPLSACQRLKPTFSKDVLKNMDDFSESSTVVLRSNPGPTKAGGFSADCSFLLARVLCARPRFVEGLDLALLLSDASCADSHPHRKLASRYQPVDCDAAESSNSHNIPKPQESVKHDSSLEGVCKVCHDGARRLSMRWTIAICTQASDVSGRAS